MRNSYTSYLSSVDDNILVSQIKSVFERESENQRPSRNVMQFLLGYAAGCLRHGEHRTDGAGCLHE